MYKSTAGQSSLFENPANFIGAKLNPKNRWVKMAAIIPWDLLDEKYDEQFQNKKVGNPAKAARMALGSHIIKEKFVLSDEETVEHIKESPYLQWFIGMPEFTGKAPFDASTMTWFRKRLTPEMLAEVNGYIIGNKKDDDDDDRPGMIGGSTSFDKAEGTLKNKGTLILDATCTPADIKYPTDVSLLNEAREKLEDLITSLHSQNEEGCKKPRTYKNRARKQYLRFARNRRPNHKVIRKAIK
ncbi:MAG TPA: transposase, partial [Clostridia bacterium]|nr:transposase [Clostridia bacterium]